MLQSLFSPITGACFLTQSQSSSTHSVFSSHLGHCFIHLSPFTLTWSLLSPSSPVLSCLIKPFCSVSPNILTWQLPFKKGSCSSSSHQVLQQCSAVVAPSSVMHVIFLIYMYLSPYITSIEKSPDLPLCESLRGLLRSLPLRGNDLLFCRPLRMHGEGTRGAK